ncbi:hypothetical protein [Mycolicibacterium baixiangningiae]|uniref:hypothetical protein n=1 Tax=Mycolicibacterium baixiangningiae TaxID=2761578 RepID=UPI0018D1284E|nr:hypothetical protein [Mycolicibacterium baixiangningiae]
MAKPEIPQSLLGINLGDATGPVPQGTAARLRHQRHQEHRRPHPLRRSRQRPHQCRKPEGEPPIPTTDPEELSAAVKAIDGALAGIALVLSLRFLVPIQYEKPLELLADGAIYFGQDFENVGLLSTRSRCPATIYDTIFGNPPLHALRSCRSR